MEVVSDNLLKVLNVVEKVGKNTTAEFVRNNHHRSVAAAECCRCLIVNSLNNIFPGRKANRSDNKENVWCFLINYG